MSEVQPFGVYGKIAKVMLEMGAVDKDAKHFQGYQYQSAEAVVTALRHIMANVGLVMLSECIQSTDTGNEWLCEYRYTFVDVDDGSNHSLLWQQSTPYMMKDKLDDKAMGKNHTYAQKYFLMRTFLISSKDDPDADTNVSNDYKKTPKKKPIDLDTWNKDNMTKFWNEYHNKRGISQSDIFTTLEISALGEWSSDYDSACWRMETFINRQKAS